MTLNVPALEIQYAIQCEACFVSKDSTCLLDRILTSARGTTGKIVAMGRNQVECATLLYPSHVQEVVFNECWYGDSPLCISSTPYCRRANSAGLPAVINDMKCAWVQMSALRTPLCVQPYSCCAITLGLAKN